MSKDSTDQAREDAIRYFNAAVHGQPSDVTRFVDNLIAAAKSEPALYILNLSEMLQAEQRLRYKAEAEVVALKARIKKRTARK